mgnify:CR=1 FL=1
MHGSSPAHAARAHVVVARSVEVAGVKELLSHSGAGGGGEVDAGAAWRKVGGVGVCKTENMPWSMTQPSARRASAGNRPSSAVSAGTFTYASSSMTPTLPCAVNALTLYK